MANLDLIGYGPRRGGLSPNPVLNAQYARGAVEGQDLNNQSGAMQLIQAQRAMDLENSIDPVLRDEALRMSGQGQGGGPPPGTMAPTAPGPSPFSNLPAPSAKPVPLTGQVLPPQGRASGGQRGPAPALPPISGESSPLVGNLARIPGAGRTAWGIAQQQQANEQNRKSAYLDKAFEAFGRGNLPLAKVYSDAIGVTWPEEVWRDANAQRALGEASKWKGLYGADLTGFGKAMQYAMKTAEANQGKPDWASAFRMFPPHRPTTAAEMLVGQGSMKMRDAREIMRSHPGMALEDAYAFVGGHAAGGGQKTAAQVQMYQQLKADYLAQHPGDEKGFLDWYSSRGRGGAGATKSYADLAKVQWVQDRIPRFKGDPEGAWRFVHTSAQNPAKAIGDFMTILQKGDETDFSGKPPRTTEQLKNDARKMYLELSSLPSAEDGGGEDPAPPSPMDQALDFNEGAVEQNQGGAEGGLSDYSTEQLLQMLQQQPEE